MFGIIEVQLCYTSQYGFRNSSFFVSGENELDRVTLNSAIKGKLELDKT